MKFQDNKNNQDNRVFMPIYYNAKVNLIDFSLKQHRLQVP